jgi:two-component system, sensor histidine kinase LadS
LASTDALTNLGNRRHFTESFRAHQQSAKANHQSVALIVLDVDYFKSYNDHYGHPAGDACLQRIGALIQACIKADLPERQSRVDDLAARIGGEEFAILLVDANARQAYAWAENLRAQTQALAEPHQKSPLGVMSISVGVSTAAGEALALEVLMQQADAALYEAKRLGRNRVAVSD